MAAFLLFIICIFFSLAGGLFGVEGCGVCGGLWQVGGGGDRLGGAVVLVLARARSRDAFWVRLLMGSGGGIYVVVEWRVVPTGCVG